MNYKEIISNCWAAYKKMTPSAGIIHELLEQQGEQISNDHIAFRTFNHPKTNIDILAKHLIKEGYVEKGTYHFEQKKLNAKHFEHPDNDAPKIFISELLLENFSSNLNDLVNTIIEDITSDLMSSSDSLYTGRPWGNIEFEKYQQLLNESEYAAWLYVYGFCANHFTINVNELQSINDMESMNDFLKLNGFTLNSAGGEIKGSVDELLEQSSIMADISQIEFTEGVKEIPSCYYEFAKRYPVADGTLFQGFIAKSADKIFESTNTK
ncbi:MAG: DUF1338 domain-containing protein [Reichenbachiella sp.]